MAISSGDMVLIAEADRFIDSRNQVATLLFDSIADEIVDFNSMIEAIKRAYGEDPSLQNLIQNGGITEKGWLAIFEHPKTQRLLRKNTFNSNDPSKIKAFRSAQAKETREIEKIRGKAFNTVEAYVKKRTSSGVSFYKQDPKRWTKAEESFLRKNQEKYSAGVLFLKHNIIFWKKRSLSSFKSKLSKLKKKP